MRADAWLSDDLAPPSRWRRFREWLLGLPVRTMVLWLVLISTVFATRNRWGAWRQIGHIGADVHPYIARAAVFSPDGSMVVTIAQYDKRAHLWDSETLRPIRHLEGHEGQIWSVGFTPDGSHIVTTSEDGTVRFWEAKAGKLEKAFKHSGEVHYFPAFSPDGTQMLVYAMSWQFTVWDVPSGERVVTLQDTGSYLGKGDFSPDGSRIMTGTRICEASSKSAVAEVNRGHLHNQFCCFSPDGRFAVAVYKNPPRLALLNSTDGRVAGELKGHTKSVRGLVWFRYGKRFVTASEDHTARVWDLDDIACVAVLAGHTSYLNDVSVSPSEDRIVTAADDGTVRIWDSASFGCLAVVDTTHGSCYQATLSPDGKQMATVTSSYSVALWLRIRPEWWWGVFWLPEFWALFVLGCALAWSVWRDVRTMRDGGRR